MDGLLGIGAAGGKASSSEGKMLAARLDTLRKERASRTPPSQAMAQNQQQPMPVGAGTNMPNQPLMPTGAAGGPSQRQGRRAGGGSKRKNRRKGKRQNTHTS